MKRPTPSRPIIRRTFLLALALLVLVGCERPDPEVTVITADGPILLPPTPFITPHSGDRPAPPTPILQRPGGNALPTYFGTPTPDPPRPSGSGDPFRTHNVSSGETLGYIAQLYGSTVEELMAANELSNVNLLHPGQELQIPVQSQLVGPSFKLIPDSELVYGPAARGFDVRAFGTAYNGHLLAYGEDVEGQYLAGPEIVQLVADRYSVNPRLLLAALEYRAGWVTRTADTGAVDNPFLMGYQMTNLNGLYRQLGTAANALNWGFYARAEGGAGAFLVGQNTRVAFALDINDGTAGVQNFLGSHDNATYEMWLRDVAGDGFFATYNSLFGNPFAYTVDPLWPPGVAQPPLQLPWAGGETWYFTGGPHGGWASGTAWAALDFVPHSDQLGCVRSDAWVTAMADGIVSRSGFGAVVVDLDGDGYAGTGWAITYMHLETRDRIPAGTYVQAGDRLGHPSCEGGFSNGTHVHVARTYNGRWVAADGAMPFVMGGWVSQGLGREYDGHLVRGGIVKEACQCRAEINAITAD